MGKRSPAEFRDWPESLPVGYGPYRARIRYHVDGDTFDAFVDLGGRSYDYWAIRLLGVNTPETNRGSTREAGLAAKAFVMDVMPVGCPVLLTDTRPDPDVFGRWLCHILLAPGTELGALLLDTGHAVPFKE